MADLPRSGAAPGSASERLELGMRFAPALVLVVVVTGLLLPVPKQVLDLLLSANILLAVVILVTATQAPGPLAFSSFPTLLLLTTGLRLGLNVSATKLILGQGDAGVVIRSVGATVVSGDYFIGFVVLVVLFVIQIMVLTNGAGRIAEIAARYHLDALPAQQLAIDSDARLHKLTEEQVKQRRDELQQVSEFYGHMDGAAKFIKGEAVIAIVIPLLNLLGGFAVGMLRHGQDLGTALTTYSTLTIGDGLATALPGVLISLATGILVSRGSEQSPIGTTLFRQLFDTEPSTFFFAGGLLGALGAVPGMPTLPFWTLAALAIAYAVSLRRRRTRAREAERQHEREERAARQQQGPSSDIDNATLFNDDLAIDFGIGLAEWAAKHFPSAPRSADSSPPFALTRITLAEQLGLVISDEVAINDNFGLGQFEYVISARGVELGRGILHDDDMVFIWSPSGVDPALLRMAGGNYEAGRDPLSGSEGAWLPKALADPAKQLGGHIVLEPIAQLREHFRVVCIDNAARLLSRRMTERIVERLRKRDESLVKDLLEGPQKVSLSTLHRVLQGLLAEGVPIKDLATICETLLEHSGSPAEALIARCRVALAGIICGRFAGPVDGVLYALALAPDTERRFLSSLSVDDADGRTRLGARPDLWRAFADELERALAAAKDEAPLRPYTVLLVRAPLRRPLADLLRRRFPQLPVLSLDEVPPQTTVIQVGAVAVDPKVVA